MEQVLLITLLAGIVSMDTTAGPQLLISEPLVACTAAGFIFGNPSTGLLLGILFQMLWIGYLPLGTVHFTDNNMGALIGTAAILAAQNRYGLSGDLTRAAIIPAVLFGIWISMIGLHLRNVVRRMNSNRSEQFLVSLQRGETPSVLITHLYGIGTSFAKGIIMAIPGILLGMVWCGMVRLLPPVMIEGMSFAVPLFIGSLSAIAVLFYWARNRHWSLAFGLVAGVTLILQAFK